MFAVCRRSPCSPARRLALSTVLAWGVVAGAGCVDGGDFSTLEGALSVTPARVELNPVWAGIGGTAELTLENRGAAPISDLVLTVLDPSGEGEWSATLLADAISPGGQATALVQLAVPEGVIGTATATIAIASALDGAVAVPARASVLPAPSCDDGNPCTTDRFDLDAGVCTHETVADGSVCEDGSACTTDDRCLMGRCTGVALECDDGVSCTVDSCDAATGCVFEGVASRCDDDDPCTEDVCAAGVGCENPPLEEGALCHFDGCVEIGLCFAGLCQLHPTPNGVPCEDGDACTVADVCIDNQCHPGAPVTAGPGSPVEVRPGAYWADLCMGPEDDSWACYAEANVTAMDEVLAVARFPEGVGLVWRAPFTTGFDGPCEPSDGLYEPITIDTPEQDSDGVPDESPEDPGAARPWTDTCAAPVFLTVVGPDGDLLSTRQLSAVRGVAAATVVEADVDPLTGQLLGPEIALVSATFGGDQVVVELFDRGGGDWTAPRFSPAAAPLGLGDRIAGISIAADGGATVVVAHGSLRTEDGSGLVDCAFPGCGSAVGLITWWLPHDAAIAVVSDTLRLNTGTDDLCADPVYLPAPFSVRDLQTSLDGDSAITTFRTSPSDCADFANPPSTPGGGVPLIPGAVPRDAAWRIVFQPAGSDGLEIYSPLPGFAPDAPDVRAVSIGAQDGLLASIWQEPDYCCSGDAPEADAAADPQPPSTCETDLCERWTVGLGDGPGALVPWLSAPGSAMNQATTAVSLDGEAAIAFLSGGAVHLLRRDPDDGYVAQMQGAPPSQSAWRAEEGLLAASDGSALVAGRATAITESPGQSVEFAVVQEFSCRSASAPGEVACLTDESCGADEYCERDGICLPPGDCTGDCDAVCWGACRAYPLEDAGPTDAGLSDAGVDDAGSSDAGSSDAGSSDAGSSDAGSSDAGLADGGPDDDDGPGFDAGQSGDAGATGDAGA